MGGHLPLGSPHRGDSGPSGVRVAATVIAIQSHQARDYKGYGGVWFGYGPSEVWVARLQGVWLSEGPM